MTGVTVEHGGERTEIRGRRRRQRRRHVRARDRPDGRRHRPDHPDGPPVPLHRADRGRPPGPAAAARPGQPRLLPRGGRRPVHGRLRARPGAVVARRRPARLQRQAPGARLAALRGDHGGRHPARPGDRRRRRQPDDQRARGASRPTTSSSSASREVRGFFVAAGFCAHGIAGAGGIGRQMATLDRRRRARARPLEDGHPPVRAGSTGARRYTLARSIENYATYYDIHYPNEERQAGRPLRTVADLRRARRRSARPSARSPAGSARTGSSRTPPAGDEALRPRGWAGEHWSPAIGAEALATRRAAGLFDETSFAKIEIVGPGAVAFLAAAVRQRRRRAGRADRLHPAAQPARRHRVRPHGHPRRPPTAS